MAQPRRQHVSPRFARRVWAAITADPLATTRELADTLGLKSNSHVADALHVLRDAGYIEFADSAAHARRIVVPFVVMEARA